MFILKIFRYVDRTTISQLVGAAEGDILGDRVVGAFVLGCNVGESLIKTVGSKVGDIEGSDEGPIGAVVGSVGNDV